MTDICSLIDTHDGIALGQLIHQGDISAAELLQAVLQRIDQRDPALRAIAQRLDVQALQQAQALHARPPATPPSPLAGVPIVIKDLLADMAGLPTLSGSVSSHALALPQRDAEIIRRYRAAGLVLAAKTTLPEWGLVPYTESALHGCTRNPWDPSRTPGGSSGGAAAALAARMTPLAHGGDGGGSIRIPASNCGLFGLKPGRGRAPLSPGMAEVWQGFVTEHAITRSVRDSAAMLDILCQPCPGPAADMRTPLYHIAPAPTGGYLAALQQPLRPLRIAVARKPFTGGSLHPDVVQATEQAAALLRNLGHTVDEADPPVASADTLKHIMEIVVAASAALIAREWAAATGRALRWCDVEPATWALILRGRQLKAADMAWARETALRQGIIMEQFHQQWDVLLSPTLNQPPAPVGSLGLPAQQAWLSRLFVGRLGMGWLLRVSPLVQQGLDRLMHYMGWPVLANMTGQPAMSVPLYWTAPTSQAPAGLPIGCMFTGRMGDEVTLLQLAQQLEAAQPWWDRAPPLAQPAS